MSAEKMGVNSLKSTNTVVLFINSVLNFCLILGYVAEYLKGGKDLLYIGEFLSIVITVMLTSYIFYFRNKSSAKLKIVTLTGYLIIYAFVLLTSDRLSVFTYLFPILLMYFLYFDLKLLFFGSSIAVTLNVLNIIRNIVFLGMNDKSYTTDYTIQVCTVLMYCFSLILSSKLSNRFSEEKINSIKKEEEKQNEILKDVLTIASVLDKNSKEVNKIVGELADSTDAVSSSIHDISKGAAETAENISRQSELTLNISRVQGLVRQVRVLQ